MMGSRGGVPDIGSLTGPGADLMALARLLSDPKELAKHLAELDAATKKLEEQKAEHAKRSAELDARAKALDSSCEKVTADERRVLEAAELLETEKKEFAAEVERTRAELAQRVREVARQEEKARADNQELGAEQTRVGNALKEIRRNQERELSRQRTAFEAEMKERGEALSKAEAACAEHQARNEAQETRLLAMAREIDTAKRDLAARQDKLRALIG